jgi:hypothetical protein
VLEEVQMSSIRQGDLLTSLLTAGLPRIGDSFFLLSSFPPIHSGHDFQARNSARGVIIVVGSQAWLCCLIWTALAVRHLFRASTASKAVHLRFDEIMSFPQD